MYSIYLMYFVNSIRFGQTKVLSQITRTASRKSDIYIYIYKGKIAIIRNDCNGQKMINVN